MKRQLTKVEMQSSDFAASLHKSLRKQAETLLQEQQDILEKTAEYLSDGLAEEECAELLIIEEGIMREAAFCFINKAKSSVKEGLYEYAYSFEDMNGRVWSSFDIERNIHASSDEDAWSKVAEVLDEAELFVEFDKIISVDRLDPDD